MVSHRFLFLLFCHLIDGISNFSVDRRLQVLGRDHLAFRISRTRYCRLVRLPKLLLNWFPGNRAIRAMFLLNRLIVRIDHQYIRAYILMRQEGACAIAVGSATSLWKSGPRLILDKAHCLLRLELILALFPLFFDQRWQENHREWISQLLVTLFPETVSNSGNQ